VIALLLAITACSPPPEGAEFWKQVNREYESGDYIDTLNYLNDVLRTENTFNLRASALKVTILGGMARAALELEEACVEGIPHVPAWESQPYKTCIDQYRFQARTRTLTLIDALGEFDKAASTAGEVALDFPLPDVGPDPSSIVGRIRVGAMPAEKVLEAAIARVIDRQLILQVRALTGAGDFAAAVELFAAPPVTVSKPRFLTGVAETLLVTAALFEQGRLNDVAKRTATLERARGCLQPAIEEGDAGLQREAKALAAEIAAELGG
jgi:hypothetical protein